MRTGEKRNRGKDGSLPEAHDASWWTESVLARWRAQSKADPLPSFICHAMFYYKAMLHTHINPNMTEDTISDRCDAAARFRISLDGQ
jgi:hypothetical protein